MGLNIYFYNKRGDDVEYSKGTLVEYVNSLGEANV